MSDGVPGWSPDPFGRHEKRYHDGEAWTDRVVSHGRESVDPPSGEGRIPTVGRSSAKVRSDVAAATLGTSRGPGGGTIFTEPVLVVSQKAKLIEVNNEYAIFDQAGIQVGAVRQVGQSTVKKVLRVVSSLDQFMTHTLQIVDMAGAPLLTLTRPAKVIKSRIVVDDAEGCEVGQIVQENMVGKINFGLHAGGRKVGAIRAENWRAWNFGIVDDAGVEVARITKTWEGLARTLFTTADNFVVHIHRTLDDPLLSLVVASALGVDTALKQDSRGFG